MDILNPLQNYIDYRCAIHGKQRDQDEFERTRKKFYKEFKCEEEVKKFSNCLYEARHAGTLPLEQMEIRESDGKKHGHVVRMMIYDIEYWREYGQLKSRKIYMANQGQLSQDYKDQPKQIDLKKRASGERDPGEEG